MIKTCLHKIFSILTVTFLLLPIGLQFVHALENHEHRVCDSKELQHIHKQELDCSVYHVKLCNEGFYLNDSFPFFIPDTPTDSPILFAKKCEYTFSFYKPTRGPPTFII